MKPSTTLASVTVGLSLPRPYTPGEGVGNIRPTVTDANVVLGFINATSLAGGKLAIDRSLSEAAIRAMSAIRWACRCRTPRTASARWPMRRWRARCAPSPSSAAAIRAT